MNADLEMTQAILAEADAEARKCIEAAEASAAEALGKARAEAEQMRAEIVARGEDKARRLRARETAVVNIECRRILLDAREAAVVRVFHAIDAACAAVRADAAQYALSLRAVAAEAVRGVGGDAVELMVHENDEALVDAAFIDALTTAAAPTTVAIRFTLADASGGCIAASRDGHITLNNTYARRLERMKRAVRATIMREIAGHHE